MSLLDRMKGLARGKQASADEAQASPYDELGATVNPMEATVRLGPGTLAAAVAVAAVVVVVNH